jgi:hypothetical protein
MKGDFMEVTMYQVDAFTERVFGGNPAAVCPLKIWLPDDVMLSIAAENNLAETAFFVKEGEGFHLRWFSLVSGEQIALEVAELRRESCKVFRFGIEKPHCASGGGEIP